MTARRIVVDRIVVDLQGVPLAQAQWLAANLQDALAAQAAEMTWPAGDSAASPPGRGANAETRVTAPSASLPTSLAGQALLTAVAARLLELATVAAAEDLPWR